METTNKANTKSPAWVNALHDKLSLTDIKILEILNENGRISDAELAKKLGVSMSTVRLRRKQLESKGILRIVGVIILKNLNIPYADLILHIDNKKLDKYYNDYLPFLLNNEYVYEITQYLNNTVLVRAFHKDYQNLLVTINEILLKGREVVKGYRVYVAGSTYKAWGKNII
jgi:DNA-binding Lrp family transcriptional regulator